MIKALITLLLVVIAFISFNLGMDWINFGHGLHPLIALPVATLCVVAIFIVQYGNTMDSYIPECDENDDYINMH